MTDSVHATHRGECSALLLITLLTFSTMIPARLRVESRGIHGVSCVVLWVRLLHPVLEACDSLLSGLRRCNVGASWMSTVRSCGRSSRWALQEALQLNNQRWICALVVIDCCVDEGRGTCQLATRTDNLTYSLRFLAVDHQRCVGLMNGEYPVGGFVDASCFGGDRVELLWRRDRATTVSKPPRPLARCSLFLFHSLISLLVDGTATGTQQSTADW